MSLIIHQLKTDCRRFRIGLCFYLAVMAAQVCLPRSLSTTGAGYVSQVVLLIVAWLTALILTAAVVQSDPLVETTSFWMTRPTRRTHLFWSKTAFIVLLVALPCFGAESVVWVRRLGFDFNLWLRATAELALYAVFALALVAAASALSKSALKMVTLLISLAGAFGLWMALLSYLHARGVIRMMGHNDFESMNRMTVTWLALGVLSALAKGIEGKFKRPLERATALDERYDHGNIPVVWAAYYLELPWPKRDREKASRELRRALAFNPASLRARLYLARIAADEGRPAEARALLAEIAAAPVGRYDAPEERRVKQEAAAQAAKVR